MTAPRPCTGYIGAHALLAQCLVESRVAEHLHNVQLQRARCFRRLPSPPFLRPLLLSSTSEDSPRPPPPLASVAPLPSARDMRDKLQGPPTTRPRLSPKSLNETRGGGGYFVPPTPAAVERPPPSWNASASNDNSFAFTDENGPGRGGSASRPPLSHDAGGEAGGNMMGASRTAGPAGASPSTTTAQGWGASAPPLVRPLALVDRLQRQVHPPLARLVVERCSGDAPRLARELTLLCPARASWVERGRHQSL